MWWIQNLGMGIKGLGKWMCMVCVFEEFYEESMLMEL